MSHQETISARQAVLLLFLCRIFSTMVFVPKKNAADGSTALLGAVVAVAVQLLLVLPLALLLKRTGPRDIVSSAWEESPWLGRGTAAAMWVISLVSCVSVICQLDLFLVSTLFPSHPEGVILVLFCAAILYGEWMGLEACARFAAGVFLAYVAINLLVGLQMIPQYDLLNLRSPFRQGAGAVAASAAAFAVQQSETAAILMLPPRVRGSLGKSYLATVLLTAAGVAAVTFMTLAGLGEYARTQPYPVYALFTMANFLSLERMDSLYMALWLLIAFLKGVLSLVLARECAGYLFPRRWRPAVRVGNGLLAVGISALLIFQVRDLELVEGIRALMYPALGAGVLLPLALLILRRLREGKEAGREGC